MRKYFILLLIVIFLRWKFTGSSAWKIPIPKLNNDSNHVINQMAVKMLTKCFTDIESMVIHGDSDESIIKSIRDTGSFAVIIFNDPTKIENTIETRWKINLFLMTSDSVKQFEKSLLTLKNSRWWNIMASLFILDKSNGKCENAKEFLKAAWKMKYIKVFFLCVNSNQRSMVYTYNPYTNRAPRPWKQISTSPGWTMYARLYKNGNICRGLNFDRTRHLDGAIVNALTAPGHTIPEYSDNNFDKELISKVGYMASFLMKALQYSWNVTIVIHEKPDNTIITAPHEFLEANEYDVALMVRSYHLLRNFTISFPTVYSECYIFTNKEGFYTPLEMIKNYYGTITLVSMCIILLITFVVVFISEKKRGWSFASFEILRLLVNASLLSRMNSLSLRIVFAVIFLYFLIIQATFQGRLSEFLTKNEYRRNAETLEDLQNSKYTQIFTDPAVPEVIFGPILGKKKIISIFQCIDIIAGNNSLVCLGDIIKNINRAFSHGMHVSKRPIYRHWYANAIADTWPLKERYDKFLMQLFEMGSERKMKSFLAFEQARQKRITEQSTLNYRPISLSMLKFAFSIYGIGITLAIITFIFERRIKDLPSRTKSKRRLNTQRFTWRKPNTTLH